MPPDPAADRLDRMTTREELEQLPTKELHDRAIERAKRHLDVGFLWDLVKALPVAEEMVGDDERSKVDIARPLALINDLYDAGRGRVWVRRSARSTWTTSRNTPTSRSIDRGDQRARRFRRAVRPR